jgi:methyl-accepting chemotaxis protein
MIIQARIRNWLNRLQIQKKITLGYGLSLGIAIAGTGLGIVLADQQHQQAETKRKDANAELEIITNLQVELLQTSLSQKYVKESLTDPVRLQKYYPDLQRHYKYFQQNWQKFKETEGGTKGQNDIERDGEIEAVESFLKKYEGVPEAYIQVLDRLPLISNPNAITPEELIRLREVLNQLEQSKISEGIHDFTDELPSLTAVTDEEYEEAQLAVASSQTLRLWVIGISMAASAAIALILSLLTSRAIARPIRSLTDITQQALHESNFKLQAPVISGDEIGTLAISFNQLIAAIEKLLDQKQEYSQNLEIKINERTQELNDKNIQLQELVEKLHSTQVQMIQSEKMSSLGQLVAGVAHEINNPVNFIHGNLTHVQEYTANLLNFISLYQEYYPNLHPEIAREAKEIDLEFLQEDMPKILLSTGQKKRRGL